MASPPDVIENIRSVTEYTLLAKLELAAEAIGS
jgi:hypothetical protein